MSEISKQQLSAIVIKFREGQELCEDHDDRKITAYSKHFESLISQAEQYLREHPLKDE